MPKIPDQMDQQVGRGHSKESGAATTKELFEAVVDDLESSTVATIASPDASDLATAITLVNEIKASINTSAAAAKKLTK